MQWVNDWVTEQITLVVLRNRLYCYHQNLGSTECTFTHIRVEWEKEEIRANVEGSFTWPKARGPDALHRPSWFGESITQVCLPVKTGTKTLKVRKYSSWLYPRISRCRPEARRQRSQRPQSARGQAGLLHRQARLPPARCSLQVGDHLPLPWYPEYRKNSSLLV